MFGNKSPDRWGSKVTWSRKSYQRSSDSQNGILQLGHSKISESAGEQIVICHHLSPPAQKATRKQPSAKARTSKDIRLKSEIRSYQCVPWAAMGLPSASCWCFCSLSWNLMCFMICFPQSWTVINYMTSLYIFIQILHTSLLSFWLKLNVNPDSSFHKPWAMVCGLVVHLQSHRISMLLCVDLFGPLPALLRSPWPALKLRFPERISARSNFWTYFIKMTRSIQ